jgi:hypothetical protein
MRTNFSFRPAAAVVAVGLLLFAALPAVAESVLNLTTGQQWSMDPDSTESIVFTMANDGTTAAPDDFIGWVLGLQFVPRSGTSGSLTVGSLSGGPNNPMPVGTLDITQPSLLPLGSGAVINGLTNYYFMAMSTLDTFGTVAVGQTYDMGSLQLTSSADALGTWDVYTVQQNSPLFKTYWFDGSVLEQPFGNLPWVGGGNQSLALGTVEVVPEPSSLALLGLAGLGAGGYAWRRRGRKAATVGGAIAA